MRISPLLSLVPALLGAACGDETPRRPSVILISLDTLRADHMGLYGYEHDTTPYLDRLAAECTVFENAYATAAWTLVSHMSMLTGLYPRQHGVYENELALNPETSLLAERLRRAGYHTIGLYFPGWVHPRHGFDRGFDVFLPHANAQEAERTLSRVLGKRDPDRPFFLFLHLFDVHCGTLADEPGPVYDTPPPYDEAFMQAPVASLGGRTEKEIWQLQGPFEPGFIEALTALYDGGIRYVDSKLERWIEGWRAEGFLEHTLLIITADHGEGLGQRGRIDGHGTFYQEGLRVPLLVRAPAGHGAGRRVRELVSLVDIAPTVLEAVGLPANGLPGRSVFEPLADRTVLAYQPARETLIRWPRKLVLTKKGKTVAADLETDPLELQPMRADVEEVVRLRDAVLGGSEELSRWPQPLRAELDPVEAAELSALGYGGGDGD